MIRGVYFIIIKIAEEISAAAATTPACGLGLFQSLSIVVVVDVCATHGVDHRERDNHVRNAHRCNCNLWTPLFLSLSRPHWHTHSHSTHTFWKSQSLHTLCTFSHSLLSSPVFLVYLHPSIVKSLSYLKNFQCSFFSGLQSQFLIPFYFF